MKKLSVLILVLALLAVAIFNCVQTSPAGNDLSAELSGSTTHVSKVDTGASGSPTKGDVNGDGTINLTDAMLILRKIAEWTVTIDTTAADVNSDGSINQVDALLILRHFAGWEVIVIQTKYTVVFKDYDDTVLKTQEVEKGESATAPANPSKEGCKFVKWDKAFDNVQTDIVVYAVYEEPLDPTIYVSHEEAAAGDTVEVSIYVKNNPGVAGAMLSLSYNPKLTLTAAQSGDAFSTLTCTKPGKFVSPCNFLWDSESGMTINDGKILTLTFTVADDVNVGDVLDVSCSYRVGDIYDENMEDVAFEVLSGLVEIK